MEQIAITVPYGVVPGQQMKATTPDGRAFMITVPSELSVYIRPPPDSRHQPMPWWYGGAFNFHEPHARGY